MVMKAMSGVGYLLRGLKMLSRPGLRHYVILPLTVNVLLFGSGIWYLYGWFQKLYDWVDGFLPSWLHWLQWLLAPLLVIVTASFVFFSFSMVANLIAAPFNSLLAERVEYLLTGRFPGGEATTSGGLLHKTAPLLWSELNKIFYSLAWMLPFLLFFIIPVVNLAAPFLWVLYSAWMMAIQYADIPMGNHDLTGRQVRRHLRQERLLGLGFGGAVLLLNTLPLINFLAMPAAVVGATLLWVERFQNTGMIQDGVNKPGSD
ncbi:MAG: sulfate transporter CysZ [Magnetococcales bacterium]|nr:sulfate transporter CysZ [Magnetococcales bacterium]